MKVMASQITGVSIVSSAACSGADQRKHQSSMALAFLRGIDRWSVNFPKKGPVTRKMFPFDDFIMLLCTLMARCLQLRYISFLLQNNPDDVIKWKHFPGYWPIVQGIRRSPVNYPQRPMTRSFNVFFDLCLNKRLSKQSWGWWFSTPSRSLWRRCNVWAPWHFWFWTILNIIMRLDCNVDETATVYNFRLA